MLTSIAYVFLFGLALRSLAIDAACRRLLEKA